MPSDPAALTLRAAAQAMQAWPKTADRLRIFFEFMRGAEESGLSALHLVNDEPAPIGDPRFDSLVAAAADLVTTQLGEPCPPWATAQHRFLQTPWWTSDLRSGQLFAMAHCPRAFRIRGIYIDARDLTSDGRRWADY
ncbi:hypothetical protein [Mycobacterium sp. NPDC050853]|uniref:hypothetical protein n=1 Tax=Mycobacterium sp. NPDC050853 TaxID=3155160 RepID=UPI00340CAD34